SGRAIVAMVSNTESANGPELANKPGPANGPELANRPDPAKGLPLRAKVAVSVSKTAAALSRAAGRGDGSVIGGWIGLKIDPQLLAHLAAGRRVALISG